MELKEGMFVKHFKGSNLIEKNIYQETDPPRRSLPKALVAEMDFNERRERAIEKLRNYIA